MPKVLLVEDDNNLREIFQMRLQAEGYATSVAADGEEGLVMAMKEKPDLVIADVMMPKLSGFEMVENLRAAPETKEVKVIMMTALGQAEDQARGEKLGVVKYLVKSQVTLEDFARVVKETLGPGNPPDATAPQVTSSTNNNLESESSMQQDPPVNPTPTPGGDTPAPQPSMPASDPTAAPSGDMGAPAAPADDATQQSTAQEQSVVNDQVNNFAASAPAEPAADTGAPASTDATAPAMPPTSEPTAPSDPATPVPGGDTPPATPVDPTSNAL
jgi:CheY-like chemotaxis protein